MADIGNAGSNTIAVSCSRRTDRGIDIAKAIGCVSVIGGYGHDGIFCVAFCKQGGLLSLKLGGRFFDHFAREGDDKHCNSRHQYDNDDCREHRKSKDALFEISSEYRLFFARGDVELIADIFIPADFKSHGPACTLEFEGADVFKQKRF